MTQPSPLLSPTGSAHLHLDHVTIRTRDLEATRQFFLTVFDLEEGERPRAIRRIAGHWLYAAGHPLVHIIASQDAGLDRPAEAIDHVGFRMEGYAEFREKLDRLDIRYSLMELAELQERRLFFRAPGGPLLEAVFSKLVPENR
jgi:catechol 2,3-dioxygenase-like lactoylglutathione lyase family enzyme